MIGNNPIFERKLSGFQLSIATGMAMETLFAPIRPVFDPDRVPPPRASLRDYDSIYINVDTLLRNIMNASTFESAAALKPRWIADALFEEIEQIQSLCLNEGKGLITPVFYLTNYANFYRQKSDEYQLRVPGTDLQREWFTALVQGRTKAISDGLKLVYAGEDIRPASEATRSLLLSHITPDLLSYRHFGKLELLESHTGKIKTRREWNTKYHPLGKEKFENMPWCKPLLCYLGDNYILCPLGITIRKKILQLSKDRRWTPMTSGSTVLNDCVTRITDPATVKILREISVY